MHSSKIGRNSGSSEAATSVINMRGCATFTSIYKKCVRIFFVLNKCMHSLYADMAAARYSSDVLQTSNCQLSEAIQNLPPELREMILKEYIAMKIKEKKEMAWDKVHENILKLPFCQYRQQIVPMVICFEYANCYFEGCCFPCFEREGNLHKVSLSRPMELIKASPKHKNFLKVCSWDGYDWHEWFLFGRER